ncbi:unnamed protein product [Dovyalis caffra]|uniref:Uncharacterized protein n=1 Tax=Dovyalis caffra TaxID=77055 RepID=A0AAV1S952_9ROSI|nr:unnamed protein product [Dovyalis caffra]
MEDDGRGAGTKTQWWWWCAMASMAQLGWGISSLKKGYAGDSRYMPLKACAVASLFVGSAASASIAVLKASGMHTVEDFLEVGANMRTGLGIPPRVPKDEAASRMLKIDAISHPIFCNARMQAVDVKNMLHFTPLFCAFSAMDVDCTQFSSHDNEIIYDFNFRQIPYNTVAELASSASKSYGLNNKSTIDRESIKKKKLIDRPQQRRIWSAYHCAKDLKKADIHFWPSNTNVVTDVKFKSKVLGGMLKLPQITIDDSSKSLLLNLIAYERCVDASGELWASSYIWFFDPLIQDFEDAQVLQSEGILVGNLGCDQQVADHFNEMARHLMPNPYVYNDVKWFLDNHYKGIFKKWIAEWLQVYFSVPWTFIAFVAATFGLTLTAIQSYLAAFPSGGDASVKKPSLFITMHGCFEPSTPVRKEDLDSFIDVRRYFGKKLNVSDKNGGGPVTVADTEAEEAIVSIVLENLLSHAVFGKETRRNSEDVNTITSRFQTLFALWIPLMEQTALFVEGLTGRKTTKNCEQVSARACQDLVRARVDVKSRQYSDDAEFACDRIVGAGLGQILHDVSCFAYGSLASGSVDLVVDCVLDCHDFLALIAVLEGAGVVISDWEGNELYLDVDPEVYAIPGGY